MNLSQHKILVTGGTRGIGLSLAAVFTSRGSEVAVCGRDENRLAEVRQRLPNITALRCDLTDVPALPDFVSRLRSSFGTPTVLVNNAGIQFNHTWPECDASDLVAKLTSEIAVNLTSPLALTALLLDDLMRSDSAAIVNVSSLLALAPKRSAPVYCATKAAVRSFSQGLRYQLEPYPHVRVVEVLPPLVETAMTSGRGGKKISPEQAADEIVKGLEAGASEIYVGDAKKLRVLHRLAPGFVAKLMRDG